MESNRPSLPIPGPFLQELRAYAMSQEEGSLRAFVSRFGPAIDKLIDIAVVAKQTEDATHFDPLRQALDALDQALDALDQELAAPNANDWPSEIQEHYDVLGLTKDTSIRVGKAKAGRLLDGKEHLEVPE